MRCEYIQVGTADDKHVCKCVTCGHVRVSKYPPEQLHRQCSNTSGLENPLDCPHRGPAIATHTCQLCGARGKEIEVYECGLHGQCVLRRWSDKNEEAKNQERICLICPDRTLAADL